MMGATRFRGGYEFDPETYAAGGGLPGMLWRAMQEQGTQEQGDSLGSAPNRALEYDSGDYDSPQGGLHGRLIAVQTEQNRYQPVPGDLRPAPNFRQLSRVSNGNPQPMANPSVASAETGMAPSRSVQYEAGQAQQAREVAAARLARGARSLARAEGPPPDPVDIAKSAAIGLANGTVNTLGLPGEIATGFGYLPNNLLLNGVRRAAGYSDIPADEPDRIRQYATSDGIRQKIEELTSSEFYQPRTRTGRYVETVGEFVPAILGSAGLAGVRAGAAALRELPATIAKHAVAPGVVVQGLEDAYPESEAGGMLQKGYPLARRVLPPALSVGRYLASVAPR
jgi:hypothetical protein